LINTLEKFCYTKLAKQFDAVICDECHHVAEETRYERAFKEITAPFKIGLTGTLPPDDKRMLTMIGLFGPVLDKIEYEELQDAGILADPTIYLHEALHTEDLPHIDDWKRAYSRGIVHNAFRNKQITLIVEDFIKRGLTGLVMIREIKHGKNLVEMFKEHQIKNFKFVYGGTEQDERNAVRKALANKEHDVVICSIIWNEGINIPSLGAIVKADGGSSEIKTIQAAGRGLRTTEEKTELEFHDFMDRGNRYLAAHSLDRIATYLEKKWRIVYGGK
jgi:superfamily II DNA or RNA helicase